jgi:hypothetical protein
VKSVPDGWGVGVSATGWMTAAVFFEYVVNVFNPWLVENAVKKPVALFLDGHRTHLTYEISVLCAELQIEVFCFLPNSTHILQPADVGVFAPLKAAWIRVVNDWQQKTGAEVVRRTDFAPLVAKTFSEAASSSTVRNGFRRCGIFPFDADAVDYSKCLEATTTTTNEYEPVQVQLQLELDTIEAEMSSDMKERMSMMEKNVLIPNEAEDTLYRLWAKSKRTTTAAPVPGCSNWNSETATHPPDLQMVSEPEVRSSGSETPPPDLQTVSEQELRSSGSDADPPSLFLAKDTATAHQTTPNYGEYFKGCFKYPEPRDHRTKTNIKSRLLPCAVSSQAYRDHLEKINDKKEGERMAKMERKNGKEE